MGKAENDIKAACIELLEMRGAWVRNNPVGLFKTLWGGVVRIGKAGDWELHEVANPYQHLEAFTALLTVWFWQHDTDKYKEVHDVATV
jgi:hypothetical protein